MILRLQMFWYAQQIAFFWQKSFAWITGFFALWGYYRRESKSHTHTYTGTSRKSRMKYPPISCVHVQNKLYVFIELCSFLVGGTIARNTLSAINLSEACVLYHCCFFSLQAKHYTSIFIHIQFSNRAYLS